MRLGAVLACTCLAWSVASNSEGAQDQRPAEVVCESWWRFNGETYLHQTIPSSTCLPAGFLGPGGEARPFLDRLGPSEAILRDTVIPSLLKALRDQDARREPSIDMVKACLLALAKAGRPHMRGEAIRTAIDRYLESTIAELQEAALLALGVLGDERSLPRLQAVLLGLSATRRGSGSSLPDPALERIRACAALGLGLSAWTAKEPARQRIVDTLVFTLESGPRARVARDVHIAALMALGLAPLPLPETAQSPMVEGAIRRPLRVTNGHEQLLWLLHTLEDRDRPELERAQIPLAISRVLKYERADHPLRRAVAARLLAQVRSDAAAERAVRAACISAWGELAGGSDEPLDAGIREALLSEAVASDDRCSCLALMALGQIAGRQVPGPSGAEAECVTSARSFLIRRLRSGSPEQRPWAALGLALLERGPRERWNRASEEGRAALLDALGGAQDSAEYKSFAIVVGMARLHGAEPALREQLEPPRRAEVTGATALALGLLDDRASVPLLLEAARRARYPPDLVRPLAEGLSMLAEHPVPEEMVRLLGLVSGRTAQAALADALGRIDDVRTIAPLIALLQDEERTDRARSCAASALGTIADKMDVPWNARLSRGIDCWDPPSLLSSPGSWTGLLDRLH